MNRERLQERIDEYNAVTSIWLKKIQSNLYNIEECFLQSNDYYNPSELIDLKSNLEGLYQWQLCVSSFVDGYSVAKNDNDPQIKYVVVMSEVIPRFPSHLKERLITEYSLNYTNSLATEIYI